MLAFFFSPLQSDTSKLWRGNRFSRKDSRRSFAKGRCPQYRIREGDGMAQERISSRCSKEKKAEQRCKWRPRGAEPLKVQINSLIYKRTPVNRQPHQHGNPGDAPLTPQVTGFRSPGCEGMRHVPCHCPSSWDGVSYLSPGLGLWMEKHSLQEGSAAGMQP